MSTNHNNYLSGQAECDRHGPCVKRVGYANINRWVSMGGNAEEINNFATQEEARVRGYKSSKRILNQ